MFYTSRLCIAGLISTQQSYCGLSPAARLLPGKVLVSQIRYRVLSSASGPVGYSPNEITDLTALLSRALRHAHELHRNVVFNLALVELGKTPFAPTDWWQNTYGRSLKPVPPELHWQVSVPILLQVYLLRRHLLKGSWSSTTLADVKTKLKSTCFRSIKLYITQP